METITYRVRPGFVWTDTTDTPVRRYGPGDDVQLAAAVGDGIHQLERVDPEAAARAAAAAEAEQAAKDAEAAAAAAAAAAAQNDNP